jgi:hypothetical protein
VAASVRSRDEEADDGPINSALSSQASEGAFGTTDDCVDLSTDCKSWAMHGECERNTAYMVGGDGYDGQCKFSCGGCKPVSKEALDAGVPSADGMADFEAKMMKMTPANPSRALRWPQKKTSSG